MKYVITLKRGLGSAMTVEAESEDMARREALAEYRRTTGWYEWCESRGADDVIESVVPMA